MAPPRTRERKLTQDDLDRAARIRLLVDEKGWSNKEFAFRIGVNDTAATNLRSGKTVPREATLRRICKVFGVSPGWVLFGPPHPKRQPEGAPLRIPAIPRRGGEGGHPGVNRWLRGTAEGQQTSAAEKAWLRGCPWPDDLDRAPDEAYIYALKAFKVVERHLAQER